MSEELRAEPAPRFRCVCGTEDMVTRERDGTLIDKIRCPGCERIWERVTDLKLSVPAWSNQQTAIMREGCGPPVGQEPKPMPFPEAEPPTPHIKCACGRHLDTRARNGRPWEQIRCDGTYGCWRSWRLSDSFDGDGYVWIGYGSGGQRPWNAVRHERNAQGPLTTAEHIEAQMGRGTLEARLCFVIEGRTVVTRAGLEMVAEALDVVDPENDSAETRAKLLLQRLLPEATFEEDGDE